MVNTSLRLFWATQIQCFEHFPVCNSCLWRLSWLLMRSLLVKAWGLVVGGGKGEAYQCSYGKLGVAKQSQERLVGAEISIAISSWGIKASKVRFGDSQTLQATNEILLLKCYNKVPCFTTTIKIPSKRYFFICLWPVQQKIAGTEIGSGIWIPKMLHCL